MRNSERTATVKMRAHQIHQVAVQRLRRRRRREPIHDERDLVRLVEAAVAHAEAVVRRLAAQVAHGCWRMEIRRARMRAGASDGITGACA